jgi:NADPH:quinone reductase-like Zn-dependent oxidoreductase
VARKETHEFLKALGADRLIDYTTSIVADEVKDADVVIELVGGDTCIHMLRTLRKGGLLVSARNFRNIAEIKEAASKLDVDGSWFMVEPDYVGLDQLAALIQRGSLKVEISLVFPLERAVETLETIARRGAVGKTVIKVS